MKLFAQTLLGILLLLVSVKVHLWWGRKILKAGYEAGRKAEADWWIGIERESNGVREEIWRKELKRS